MPIRQQKNPFPKVKPLTNSGIFSKSGSGQKMDGKPSGLSSERRTHSYAMGTSHMKNGSANSGKGAGSIAKYAMSSGRKHGTK